MLRPELYACWLLQDRWRTLATIQHCTNCNAELPHGESARYQVYVPKETREFLYGYTCFGCEEGRR